MSTTLDAKLNKEFSANIDLILSMGKFVIPNKIASASSTLIEYRWCQSHDLDLFHVSLTFP